MNLVRNPDFHEKTPEGLPAYWTLWAPRDEITPVLGMDQDTVTMSGGGNFAVHGRLQQRITQVEPGKSYAFECRCKAEGVRSVHESVGVKLTWRDGDEKVVRKDYVQDPDSPALHDGEKIDSEDGWIGLRKVVRAREGVMSVEIELVFQWAAEGTVWWDQVRFLEVEPPPRRTVRLSNVHCVPRDSTPQANRDRFSDLCCQAAERNADLVVLPECITVPGTGLTAAEVAEPIPGPSTEQFAAVARAARMYIVLPIYERDGHVIYNTTVLLGREGEIVGRYRKVHLPPQEVEAGVTPGDEFPVFETNFGKIGIETCYDHFFPEMISGLARNGAQIVCLPIWGGHETEGIWHAAMRTRAVDNGVYLVASTYCDKGGLIVRPDGQVLVEALGQEGVYTADVELMDGQAPSYWVWQWSDMWWWKECYWKERRPEVYQTLVRTS
jgi:predicted amidohydrolase